MTQRAIAFLLLLVMFAPLSFAADAVRTDAKATDTTVVKKLAESKSAKTPEQHYLDANDCLKPTDTICAQVELAGMNPASPYAKLLQGQIAAAGGDYDTALRLLLPLQAEKNLIQGARASLHATLANAYAHQENPLRALEQYIKASALMNHSHQEDIWELLSGLSKDMLLEMRGEGDSEEVQGWIDLALAAGHSDHRAKRLGEWRQAYPYHPVNETLLSSILDKQADVPEKAAVTAAASGKIALLLPVDSPVYAQAAQAVLAGFMAAHDMESDKPEVQVYNTGSFEDTQEAYKKAVYEGAQWVVGPLTRDGVDAVIKGGVLIPTLVLNQTETEDRFQDKLVTLTLSADMEARQVARMTRELGIQTVQVVVADTPLSRRVSAAFIDEWESLDGTVSIQLDIPAHDKLGELKKTLGDHPADMIFIAANAVQARLVRPYLDAATPTYSVSQIYDGEPTSLQNLDLLAVRFVDMPWMLAPDNSGLLPFRLAAARFKSADLQRLFALGVDAYHLLPTLQDPAVGQVLLDGLTGKIHYDDNGNIIRELSMAQFRREGVAIVDEP